LTGLIGRVTQSALSEGTRAGGVLAVWTIVLAVLGLAPAFSWIPEVPLLTVGAVVPAVVLGFTGFRVALNSRRIPPGVIASALAGAISGGVGGLAYVVFGRPRSEERRVGKECRCRGGSED